MSEQQIAVMIANGHPIVRRGLCTIIDSQDDMQTVAEAASSEECLQLVLEMQPDVVVIDPQMPDNNWLGVIHQLSLEQPGIRMLVLADATDGVQVRSAIKAGAAGFLLTDAATDQIANAIRSVHAGSTVLDPSLTAKILRNGDFSEGPGPIIQDLTVREQDVLRLIARGFANKEIARELCLTDQTVMTHVRNILRKLALANRTQAALYAKDHGLG